MTKTFLRLVGNKVNENEITSNDVDRVPNPGVRTQCILHIF